ncbi:MAG: hypothetical protein ACD_2C00246G0002 [uncultured bacterium (gcode 4)]|uniref:Methyltransferase type 11 domain-containing protein n=1 Tax=uncultured bacterium (gcode 4) TaxID=1234023 RepID=K2GZS0_9BACT|nr:MAG: hypothetical protein ACD_2C00246G0002 [uncultured bacterium (gcode 4)]
MNHSARNLPESEEADIHPETKAIKSEWNRHSAYQWVYFDENYKKMISHYLAGRLTWSNLEIWWWWYLSHPNSAVIDVSEVALEYNPAKNKKCFDLDDLWRWKKLPYPDHSFESATMISVWQYLRFPKKLLMELERVLVPGWELYIINEQWAWITELIKQSGHTRGICQQVQELWYSAIKEDIEIIWKDHCWFKAVIVSMPQETLFGKVSEVKRKASIVMTQEEAEEEEETKANRFKQDYTEKWYNRAEFMLHSLREYPVTQFSIDLRQRFEDFSKDYKSATWEDVLLCSFEYSDMKLDMATSDIEIMVELHAKSFKDQTKEDLLRKYKLRACNHHTSLEVEVKKQLNWQSAAESTLFNYFIPFLTNTALNSYTISLQKQLYDNLKKTYSVKLDEWIHDKVARRLYYLISDNKQRKPIDSLIARKREIEKEKIPTAWTKPLTYLPYMRKIKDLIGSEASFSPRTFNFDD